MAFLDLDPTQLRATCKPVKSKSLIIAGPGSGKTRVLTTRAIYTRLEADPDKIVYCLSYTNAAVDEVERRLKKIVRREDVTQAFYKANFKSESRPDKKWSKEERDSIRCHFWVGTLHKLALAVLKDVTIGGYWEKLSDEEREALLGFRPGGEGKSILEGLLGKDPNSRLISEDDLAKYWGDCRFEIAEAGHIPPKKSRFERDGDEVSRIFRARGCVLEEGEKVPVPVPESLIVTTPGLLQENYALLESEGWIAYRYFLYKRDRNLIDFDDAITLAGYILRHSPTIYAHWEKHLAHLLIDEAQDLSVSDWYFLNSLPGFKDKSPDAKIGYTLIGDPRQEIFTWRSGSNRDNQFGALVSFNQWADHITHLTTNYRSGSDIVRLSHEVAQNPRLYMNYEPTPEKSAKHVAENGRGTIQWHSMTRRTDCEQYLSDIAANLPKEGTRAILVRTNQTAEFIKNKLLPARKLEGFDVSTIHSAKGKEWDHVVVYGLGPGKFPAAPEAWVNKAFKLKCESRLLYVAITRAKKTLHVLESDGGEFGPAISALIKG